MTFRSRVSRFISAGLVMGALVLAGLPAPAAAHGRYIVDVFGGGVKGPEDGLRASAYLNREHAGVMKFTLYKRANGNWNKVTTKRGQKIEGNPLFYDAYFNEPSANQCKFKARFTTADHATSKKSTVAFPCDG